LLSPFLLAAARNGISCVAFHHIRSSRGDRSDRSELDGENIASLYADNPPSNRSIAITSRCRLKINSISLLITCAINGFARIHLHLIDLRFSESSDNELLHSRKLNRPALFSVAAYKYRLSIASRFFKSEPFTNGARARARANGIITSEFLFLSLGNIRRPEFMDRFIRSRMKFE